MRRGPIGLLGDHACLPGRPGKQVCVVLRVWRVETGGQDEDSLTACIQSSFVRCAVDAERSSRNDDPARASKRARELVSEVQRFFIGAACPNERNRAC